VLICSVDVGSAAKEAPKAVEAPKEEPVVEKKAAARTPRASKRKAVEEVEAEAEVVPLNVAPPTPLRRSTRVASNPPTPLSAPASTSLTPRRSARRAAKDEEMPSFTLEKVIEEEEEEEAAPAPAKSPRKGRKAAAPVEDSDDEEEVAEIKKAAKSTRKTRK